MFIAREHRFSFDSTHVHLLGLDSDLQLSHIGGCSIGFGPHTLSWMNTAVTVPNGVIFGGANLGFSTTPYILRMDTTGSVMYSWYFNNLPSSQDQILSADVTDNRLDLFTWADNTADELTMLNGYTDGSFTSGLEVDAPSGIEFRVDDTEPTGNPREFIVLCQSDSGITHGPHDFLILMRVDSAGVQWASIHDHGTTGSFELEQGSGLRQMSDGNWIYTAMYRGDSGSLELRLVKMDGAGAIIWSKEYFTGSQKLSVGNVYETSDSGMLVSASDPVSSDQYVLKLNAAGQVLWSQKFEPINISTIPLGGFLKTDQGQMYGYNSSAITEMDEDINVCDMVPFSGVTSMDVTFDVTSINLTSTPFVPTMQAMPYQIRSNTYSNTQTCTFSGVEEQQESNELNLFPNPASSWLRWESQTSSNAHIAVFDVHGRTVKTESTHSSQLEIGDLSSGIYWIRLVNDQGQLTGKFVKN